MGGGSRQVGAGGLQTHPEKTNSGSTVERKNTSGGQCVPYPLSRTLHPAAQSLRTPGPGPVTRARTWIELSGSRVSRKPSLLS